jgi:hypothetical protein
MIEKKSNRRKRGKMWAFKIQTTNWFEFGFFLIKKTIIQIESISIYNKKNRGGCLRDPFFLGNHAGLVARPSPPSLSLTLKNNQQHTVHPNLTLHPMKSLGLWGVSFLQYCNQHTWGGYALGARKGNGLSSLALLGRGLEP